MANAVYFIDTTCKNLFSVLFLLHVVLYWIYEHEFDQAFHDLEHFHILAEVTNFQFLRKGTNGRDIFPILTVSWQADVDFPDFSFAGFHQFKPVLSQHSTKVFLALYQPK